LTGRLQVDDLSPEVQAGSGAGLPRLAREFTRVNIAAG